MAMLLFVCLLYVRPSMLVCIPSHDCNHNLCKIIANNKTRIKVLNERKFQLSQFLLYFHCYRRHSSNITLCLVHFSEKYTLYTILYLWCLEFGEWIVCSVFSSSLGNWEEKNCSINWTMDGKNARFENPKSMFYEWKIMNWETSTINEFMG
jgi:hypothetical protein